MPTYSCTLPANSTLGLTPTGITLASNEYVVSIRTLPQTTRVKNVNASNGIIFSSRISNADQSKSVLLGFGVTYRGCPIGTIYTYEMYDYTHEVTDADINQYLKGQTLYFKLYDTSEESGPGDILILDPVDFEITTYKPQSYILTTAVYPSNAGTVTSGGSVDVGANKQLTATPGTGYVFDRWVFAKGVFSNPNSSTATYTMPDEDATVYATFKQSGSALTAGRYNGSAYDAVIPMYYDGTNWIECDLKYYNGSNWVDSDTL